MEPGDQIKFPYQYEFRGLVFGSGTWLQTTEVDIMDLPNVNDAEAQIEGDHGTRPGVATYGSKITTFDANVLGQIGEDIESKLSICRRTFQLPRRRHSRVLDPLVYMRPGQPKKYVLARCVNRHFPSNYNTARGRCEGNFQLKAYDPIWKSLALDAHTEQLPAGVTQAQFDISNAGDFVDGYAPVMTITGPWTNPRLLNVADDARSINLDIVLGADDTLVIDVGKLTIRLNGVKLPWTDLVRNDNQWWRVLPGVNTLVVQRAVGNTGATGTFKIEWRHTWV